MVDSINGYKLLGLRQVEPKRISKFRARREDLKRALKSNINGKIKVLGKAY